MGLSSSTKLFSLETTCYKKYHDRNYKCAVLKEGDLVLIRINVSETDHKIAHKWEQAPCEVVSTKPDSPLIKIKNTATGEVKE